MRERETCVKSREYVGTSHKATKQGGTAKDYFALDRISVEGVFYIQEEKLCYSPNDGEF